MLAAKIRLDFVTRSQEIASKEPLPAILFVHGRHDEAFDVGDVEMLYDSLKMEDQKIKHPERLSIQVFEHCQEAAL